ncbi:hypothetical protein NL676_025638 [Syzygium grande]|nr:hypothetical protein NL676_025638 [Syzygium grande]
MSPMMVETVSQVLELEMVRMKLRIVELAKRSPLIMSAQQKQSVMAAVVIGLATQHAVMVYTGSEDSSSSNLGNLESNQEICKLKSEELAYVKHTVVSMEMLHNRTLVSEIYREW